MQPAELEDLIHCKRRSRGCAYEWPAFLPERVGDWRWRRAYGRPGRLKYVDTTLCAPPPSTTPTQKAGDREIAARTALGGPLIDGSGLRALARRRVRKLEADVRDWATKQDDADEASFPTGRRLTRDEGARYTGILARRWSRDGRWPVPSGR